MNKKRRDFRPVALLTTDSQGEGNRTVVIVSTPKTNVNSFLTAIVFKKLTSTFFTATL